MIDLLRDYRICRYNHQIHAGTHLHAPIPGQVISSVDIESEAEASQVIRLYAESHDVFDLDSFQEVVHEWKSASKNE